MNTHQNIVNLDGKQAQAFIQEIPNPASFCEAIFSLSLPNRQCVVHLAHWTVEPDDGAPENAVSSHQ